MNDPIYRDDCIHYSEDYDDYRSWGECNHRRYREACDKCISFENKKRAWHKRIGCYVYCEFIEWDNGYYCGLTFKDCSINCKLFLDYQLSRLLNGYYHHELVHKIYADEVYQTCSNLIVNVNVDYEDFDDWDEYYEEFYKCKVGKGCPCPVDCKYYKIGKRMKE